MGEKDRSERLLESYNDVFADIVNGLLFNGDQYVAEQSLVDAVPDSMYIPEDKVLEEERVTAKYWILPEGKVNVRIFVTGLDDENCYDSEMPLRLFSYDSASYYAEVFQNDVYPIITLVLNFGSSRWGQAKSLYDCIKVSEDLKPFVNNYKINVFDIAFLTEKEISRFHSDFRIVADYIAHHRTNVDYRPADPQKFKHTDELLKLFSVLMNETGFAMILEDKTNKTGDKPKNMCEALDRIEAKGLEEGRKEGLEEGLEEGRKKGLAEGEKKLSDLIAKLIAAHRNDDIAKVTSDTHFRNKLYKEFQID